MSMYIIHAKRCPMHVKDSVVPVRVWWLWKEQKKLTCTKLTCIKLTCTKLTCTKNITVFRAEAGHGGRQKLDTKRRQCRKAEVGHYMEAT